MQLDEIRRILDDVKQEFEHEMHQAILQRNMDKAFLALAGQDASERIARRFQFHAQAVAQRELLHMKRK